MTDGNLLNVVVFAEVERKSVWQLYDGDTGALITSADVPVPYSPWGLTDNGDLLVSYPDPETGNVYAARVRVTH